MKSKPDYWYKQSSTIPFTRVNGNLRILVITSRNEKRWILPKGIVEPELSPRESAEKESFEEAGVKGNLLPKKCGKYSYKKWGGKCRVKVYALEVTHIFDEWEENFRKRKWIDIRKAESYISDEKLLKILEYFQHNIALIEKSVK